MLLGGLVGSIPILWGMHFVQVMIILAEIFPPRKSPGTGREECDLSLTRQVQQATFRHMLLLK